MRLVPQLQCCAAPSRSGPAWHGGTQFQADAASQHCASTTLKCCSAGADYRSGCQHDSQMYVQAASVCCMTHHFAILPDQVACEHGAGCVLAPAPRISHCFHEPAPQGDSAMVAVDTAAVGKWQASMLFLSSSTQHYQKDLISTEHACARSTMCQYVSGCQLTRTDARGRLNHSMQSRSFLQAS